MVSEGILSGRFRQGDKLPSSRKLARHLGVPVSHVVAGNGSVELIDLLVRAFLGPGDNAVVSEHAFVRFRQVVDARNRGTRLVPMRDWTHDLVAMAAAIDARTRMRRRLRSGSAGEILPCRPIVRSPMLTSTIVLANVEP